MPDSGFILPPAFRVVTDAIAAVNGGSLEFYSAGTTTPKTVYSDSTLSTSLGSVVYLDSGGHPVSTQGGSTKVIIYTGSDLIKMVVKSSAGATLATYDNLKCTEDVPAGGDGGSGISGVVSKTANYTVTTNDDGLWIDGDPTGGEFTITLLSAVTAGDGFAIGLRHAGTTTTNAIKIATSGGQTIAIDGTTSTGYALTGGSETLWLVSNGANWRAITHIPPRIAWNGVIRVVDRLSSPPTSPNAGAYYIITTSPTGAWASYAQHDIVRADGQGSWIKLTPQTDCGWLAYVEDENLYYGFIGTAWVALSNITAPTESVLPHGVWQDRKSDGTAGGQATTGAWTTATLNTEVYNTITGASLSSNKVTLPAGTYLASLAHSQQDTSLGAVRLRLETAGTIYRTPNYNVDSAGNSVGMAASYVIVVPTGGDNLICEYYATTNGGTPDFGPALTITSGTEYEVYRVLTVISLTAQQGPQGSQGTQGNPGNDGGIGAWNWEISTSSGPSTGAVRFNSGTFSSVTSIYLSETDANSRALSTLIATWDDSTSTVKGYIRCHENATPTNFWYGTISALTDNGSDVTLTVSHLSSSGSFSAGDDIIVELIPKGDKGDTGAPGTTVPDISGLTAIDVLSDDDKFIVYDDSASASKSITKALLLPEINAKRDHAAAGDGSTDDTAALQAAITAAAGNRLRIPAGTYMIGAAGLDGASNIEIVGDGPGVTVLKLSTTPSTHLLEFHTLSKIRISNLTIDFNSQSGTNYAALSMTGVDQFWIDNCRIINFDKYGIAGTKITNGGITRCYFRRAAVVNTSNSSIVTSSGSGTESYNILIDGNYAENSSFSINMARSQISNNIIRYFSSGGGIFFEQNATYCNTNVVTGNIISDAPTADSLGYNCTGIECWSPRTVIANNTIYGMAGSGIDVGAQDCTVVGNICFNNGVLSGHGIMMRYSDATYNGSYSTVTGNRCWDTSGAGGTQLYGYYEESTSLTGIDLGPNSLAGNKTGEAYLQSTTTRRTPALVGAATDNVGVRFDGTTGRLIQGGPISWDDSGNISGLASATFNNTGLKLRDTNASHSLTVAPGSDLTADRTLTVTTGDADRTVTLSGNPTLADWFDQSVKVAASPQFAGIELSHATANTLTGSGGDAFVEGNRLFRAGGTDVPVADGGTGASSFTSNAVIKGNGSSALQASGVSIDGSNNVAGVNQLRVGAGICRSGTAVTSDIGLYSEPSSGWCRIAVNSGDIRMFVDGAVGNNYTGTTAAFIITSAAAVQFPGISTTASAANAYLDNGASNNLLRSTSSIRYKLNVENAELNFARNAVLRARCVHYNSDTRLCPSDNPAWGFYGLIAEEMAEIEPRLVNYTYPEDAFEMVDESYDATVVDTVYDETEEAYEETEYVDDVTKASQTVEIVIDGEARQVEVAFDLPIRRPQQVQKTRIVQVPRQIERTVTHTRQVRRVKDGAVRSVPDGVQYERLGVLNTVVIQDHEARLVALEGGAPRPVKLSDDGAVSIRVKAALADITPEATLPQIASALVALKAAFA